jgi:hypothetical protein
MSGYATPANRNATSAFGAEGYNELRDAILASVHYREPIGGSRRFTVEGTGYQDAHDYVPIRVPDAASAGAVYKVEVEMKTADPSTTITARIRNITDASDEDVSDPEDATAFATQTLTFTPVVGKEYRLQFVKSDDLFPCWGFGILQRTDS